MPVLYHVSACTESSFRRLRAACPPGTDALYLVSQGIWEGRTGMGKELSEMTLAELWQLFPIILKEHRDEYKDWYEDEKTHLLGCVGDRYIRRISHIGSTAVKGLLAKPTIDILLEISDDCGLGRLKERLTGNGWILMHSSDGPEPQTYNKGYTKEGFAEKVFHLHVRRSGDWDEVLVDRHTAIDLVNLPVGIYFVQLRKFGQLLNFLDDAAVLLDRRRFIELRQIIHDVLKIFTVIGSITILRIFTAHFIRQLFPRFLRHVGKFVAGAGITSPAERGVPDVRLRNLYLKRLYCNIKYLGGL
jgi:hypothetical protein